MGCPGAVTLVQSIHKMPGTEWMESTVAHPVPHPPPMITTSIPHKKVKSTFILLNSVKSILIITMLKVYYAAPHATVIKTWRWR